MLNDIDIKNHKLNIDHQLLYIAKIGRYIQQPKTKNGIRTIPLTPDVEKCFKTIIKNRNAPKIEPIIGNEP